MQTIKRRTATVILSRESAEAEMDWIATIQTCYHEIKEKIVVSYTNVEEAKGTKQEFTASASFLKLEKVRMPQNLTENCASIRNLKETSRSKL